MYDLPIAALLARDGVERGIRQSAEPRRGRDAAARHAIGTAAVQRAVSRGARRRTASALRRVADRLSPLPRPHM